MSDAEKAIARCLELDNSKYMDYPDLPGNRAEIYRTLAPQLAKALRIAIEALQEINCDDYDTPTRNKALTQIEEIFLQK